MNPAQVKLNFYFLLYARSEHLILNAIALPRLDYTRLDEQCVSSPDTLKTATFTVVMQPKQFCEQ